MAIILKLNYEYLSKTDLLACADLVAQKLREREDRWEIFTNFWVENLAHVATLCQGNSYAQQLRKGGEFLTHVWFLIEHMDLKEKFRLPLEGRKFIFCDYFYLFFILYEM